MPDTPKLVSIHAPRAERDAATPEEARALSGFNPRAPGGARHSVPSSFSGIAMFQSTRPGRSATIKKVHLIGIERVSIHAPRAERDIGRTAHSFMGQGFNPRAPGGARLFYVPESIAT